jgi:hypothetical protein
MTVRFSTIAAILAALAVGGCSGLWGNDEFERYSQRTDAITMSAGDAKEVNAVTHMYSPWPPGVGDRQIVTDSPRMQRSLERYRRGARPPDPLPDIGLGGTPVGNALATEPPGQGGGGTPALGGGVPTPNQRQ